VRGKGGGVVTGVVASGGEAFELECLDDGSCSGAGGGRLSVLEERNCKERADNMPRPITKAKLILILLSICRFHRTVIGKIANTTSEKDE